MQNTNLSVSWEEKYRGLEKKVAELEALIKFYEEQFRLAKHRQYGRSSERAENPEQLGLFDEAENTADKSAPEPAAEETVVPSYRRRKREGKREEDLSGLPQETVIHDLPEEEKPCPECGEERHQMSEEVRRELVIVPAQVKVVSHVTPVYACRNCERNSDHTPIAKAGSPKALIPGSIASASLIAHIAAEKYVTATPLYRQEQAFVRNGVRISRQNMANWLILAASLYFALVYRRMKEILTQCGVLHGDETTLQVLREPGRKANTNAYMWMYRTGVSEPTPIVIFEYQQTRSGKHPKAFLEKFNGFLHTDGYEAYHGFPPGITVVGCWAHLRRKFDEALKAMPENARKDSAAMAGFDYCNRLFMLERAYAEEKLSCEERRLARISRSLPVAEAFWECATSCLCWKGHTRRKSFRMKSAALPGSASHCLWRRLFGSGLPA